MEIKFDVKMTQKIMFNFLMNHIYRSFSGLIGVVFGLSAFVLAGITYGKVTTPMTIFYVIFGIWFLAYTPYHIFIRSGKQVQTNPVFKNPITYILNEEGVTTMQGDQSAEIKWDEMMKVTETKMSLLLYSGKRYSFVWPKESLGKQYEAAVKMIRAHMKDKKVKIKEKSAV